MSLSLSNPLESQLQVTNSLRSFEQFQNFKYLNHESTLKAVIELIPINQDAAEIDGVSSTLRSQDQETSKKLLESINYIITFIDFLIEKFHFPIEITNIDGDGVKILAPKIVILSVKYLIENSEYIKERNFVDQYDRSHGNMRIAGVTNPLIKDTDEISPALIYRGVNNIVCFPGIAQAMKDLKRKDENGVPLCFYNSSYFNQISKFEMQQIQTFVNLFFYLDTPILSQPEELDQSFICIVLNKKTQNGGINDFLEQCQLCEDFVDLLEKFGLKNKMNIKLSADAGRIFIVLTPMDSINPFDLKDLISESTKAFYAFAKANIENLRIDFTVTDALKVSYVSKLKKFVDYFSLAFALLTKLPPQDSNFKEEEVSNFSILIAGDSTSPNGIITKQINNKTQSVDGSRRESIIYLQETEGINKLEDFFQHFLFYFSERSLCELMVVLSPRLMDIVNKKTDTHSFEKLISEVESFHSLEHHSKLNVDVKNNLQISFRNLYEQCSQNVEIWVDIVKCLNIIRNLQGDVKVNDFLAKITGINISKLNYILQILHDFKIIIYTKYNIENEIFIPSFLSSIEVSYLASAKVGNVSKRATKVGVSFKDIDQNIKLTIIKQVNDLLTNEENNKIPLNIMFFAHVLSLELYLQSQIEINDFYNILITLIKARVKIGTSIKMISALAEFKDLSIEKKEIIEFYSLCSNIENVIKNNKFNEIENYLSSLKEKDFSKFDEEQIIQVFKILDLLKDIFINDKAINILLENINEKLFNLIQHFRNFKQDNKLLNIILDQKIYLTLEQFNSLNNTINNHANLLNFAYILSQDNILDFIDINSLNYKQILNDLINSEDFTSKRYLVLIALKLLNFILKKRKFLKIPLEDNEVFKFVIEYFNKINDKAGSTYPAILSRYSSNFTGLVARITNSSEELLRFGAKALAESLLTDNKRIILLSYNNFLSCLYEVKKNGFSINEKVIIQTARTLADDNFNYFKFEISNEDKTIKVYDGYLGMQLTHSVLNLLFLFSENKEEILLERYKLAFDMWICIFILISERKGKENEIIQNLKELLENYKLDFKFILDSLQEALLVYRDFQSSDKYTLGFNELKIALSIVLRESSNIKEILRIFAYLSNNGEV